MTSDFSTEYVQLDNDEELEALAIEDVEKFFRDWLDVNFDMLPAEFKRRIMSDCGNTAVGAEEITEEQLFGALVCTFYMTEYEDPADYVWSVMNEINA